MKKRHIFLPALLLSILLTSFDLPTSWYIAGSEKDAYEMGIDKAAGRNGTNASTIRSIKKKIGGFGTLMQDSSPTKFLGKRVRMSGYIRSVDAEKAGLWLRVDQASSDKTLSFDNMLNRPVTGTTEWTKYEIVLDVPSNASNVAFGALLVGTGQIWFDDLNFEIVDLSVPTTGFNNSHFSTQDEPTNLNFDK